MKLIVIRLHAETSDLRWELGSALMEMIQDHSGQVESLGPDSLLARFEGEVVRDLAGIIQRARRSIPAPGRADFSSCSFQVSGLLHDRISLGTALRITSAPRARGSDYVLEALGQNSTRVSLLKTA